MFPKIKKKITGFLLNEEGKVTKQSLVSLGSFLSAAVIGGVLATKSAAADHTNSISTYYSGVSVYGSHTHHSNDPSGSTGDGDASTGSSGSGSGGSCSGGACGGCSGY
jgi:hypothetical protein